MKQIKERGHPDTPPAMATDGKGGYREAMVETWGKVPDPKPSGKGLPPENKQPQPGWHYLQVVKRREGGRVVEVKVEVIYGDKTTKELVGAHTSYVERTNLTSRHINGRLVRKTLSFSKKLKMLEASSVWEDAVYNLTRPVRTLRTELNNIEAERNGQVQPPPSEYRACQSAAIEMQIKKKQCDPPAAKTTSNDNEVEPVDISRTKKKACTRSHQQRTPAMASGLADHIWTIKELLMTVVTPVSVLSSMLLLVYLTAMLLVSIPDHQDSITRNFSPAMIMPMTMAGTSEKNIGHPISKADHNDAHSFHFCLILVSSDFHLPPMEISFQLGSTCLSGLGSVESNQIKTLQENQSRYFVT